MSVSSLSAASALLDGFVLRQPSNAAQQRGQVLAVDILHGQEVQPLDHSEVINTADVRMRDLTCDPHFVRNRTSAASLSAPVPGTSARQSG